MQHSMLAYTLLLVLSGATVVSCRVIGVRMRTVLLDDDVSHELKMAVQSFIGVIAADGMKNPKFASLVGNWVISRPPAPIAPTEPANPTTLMVFECLRESDMKRHIMMGERDVTMLAPEAFCEKLNWRFLLLRRVDKISSPFAITPDAYMQFARKITARFPVEATGDPISFDVEIDPVVARKDEGLGFAAAKPNSYPFMGIAAVGAQSSENPGFDELSWFTKNAEPGFGRSEIGRAAFTAEDVSLIFSQSKSSDTGLELAAKDSYYSKHTFDYSLDYWGDAKALGGYIKPVVGDGVDLQRDGEPIVPGF